MRVLILTCNTGEGHNSCAGAIKEIYETHGDVCIIEDALGFISDGFSRFVSVWHTRVYRYMPRLFRWGYTCSEKHPAVFHQGSWVYKLITRGTEKLRQYIEDGHYDSVICVHVFASLLLTSMLKEHPMSIKTCFVATDYTCSPSVRDSDLDIYFIPHDSLAYEFEFPNITKSKMIGSGIPVRQMFYKSEDKPISIKKHLLIMCGSMGCGPIKKLTKLLSRSMKEDWEMAVVCGTNNRLCKKMQKQYADRSDIHIYGYVKDIGTLMDSADLYLTKPGGISVTEAAVKNLPMVYIDAVAGCEEYNRQFFVRMGGAKTAANINELVSLCKMLLLDDSKLNEMKAVLAEQKKVNAAECIYNTMKKLYERRPVNEIKETCGGLQKTTVEES